MPIVDGSRYRPDTTTEAPKPKPVLFGSCANCGKMMNDAYIPAPSRKAARFVVHTPRMRIIVMSISGSLLRTSTATHTAMNASPTAIRPSVFADPQVHSVVSEIASSTAEMPIVINAAASQLIFPGTRTGDSGMNLHVASAARIVATSGNQNSQW
jgi:hypothetical protein